MTSHIKLIEKENRKTYTRVSLVINRKPHIDPVYDGVFLNVEPFLA